MKEINLPPFAPTLMESTRAIGYSIETAIADVIDNSVAAGADRIDIDFFPIGESYISILDNGCGMTEAELVAAMQYGSRNPLEQRNETDLGRYGLGMKTASLSQCRILTVISKRHGIISGAQWNLPHVASTEQWSLIILEQNEIEKFPNWEKLSAYSSGTLVIWQDLDKFGIGEDDMVTAFNKKMDLIRDHLSLVFHRYLIPVKETALLLLEREYCFDGILNLVTDRNRVQAYLWPEKEYTVINVIFKAAQNPKKLRQTLEKHQKQVMKMISADAAAEQTDDLVIKSREVALSALKDYYDGKIPASAVKDTIAPAVMIQRMLGKVVEIFDNQIVVKRYDASNGLVAVIESFAVYDYLVRILGAEENGYIITNKVLCAADYGAPQKRMRFVVMGIQKSISNKVALPNGNFDEDQYRTVRDAIEDLEDVVPFVDLDEDTGIPLEKREDLNELASKLRNCDMLRNHIVTKTTAVAMKRFRALKQGENFHDLDEELKTNTYTDTSRTQNTIYQRLDYNEPSGTVLNVRKSMWVHPVKDRAISVREAARLQTFPDNFVFCGSKDKQYQQVGNAVPPILAKEIAEKLASLLAKGETATAEVV